MAQCKAVSKSTGERCKQPAVEGYEVCRYHGGRTPRGAASVHFKHGRDVRMLKALPARMQRAYEDAIADPQLLDLNKSVALIDARLIDLLSRVDTGESGALWKDVGRAYRDLRQAINAQDDPGMFKAFAQLDGLINKGQTDHDAWDEVQRLLDQRRKHVESQQRILASSEKSIPAIDVVTMMGAILDIAQKAIRNEDDRKRFVAGLQSISTPADRLIQ